MSLEHTSTTVEPQRNRIIIEYRAVREGREPMRVLAACAGQKANEISDIPKWRDLPSCGFSESLLKVSIMRSSIKCV